ncbi:sel1 repeat family protein [Streptomyces sp. NPDC056121]|uniref:sel1 repeat family protein n=1 Tax=unclassified Streptomyces TaxID=2593676 RepID=UPI0022526790|nr:sel1 repeat family protein [Streptomyces sp. NBC_00401]MCX5084416.1 sel1 repeat family protein [Streptomyces sp. NBC_00401]
MALQNEARTIEERGQGLVAAAVAGDAEAARRHTDFFVLGRRVDEGMPYWERAVEAGDAFSAYTLARYRKIRGDRREAERLYRLAADRHSGCAYGLAVLLQENGDPEAATWFRAGWDMGRLDCKIELGKLLAAEGKPDEAAEFLMKGVDIGDIAVFRWVQLFEHIRETFDRVADALEAAEDTEDGQAAGEAVEPLEEMGREFKDYPGLTDEAGNYFRRAGYLSPVALVEHAIFLERHHADDRWSEVGELLLRSHTEGYDGAAFVLGLFNEERGALAEAEHWYILAADTGHRAGRVRLSDLLRRQRRLDEAEARLREVDPDDELVPDRLAKIAQLRAEDEVPPEQDLRRLPELRERAEAGDVQASYAYGKMLYEWGGAAARWMLPWHEPAALAGDRAAAADLRWLYDDLGEPVLRDHWKRIAAEAGDHDACSAMARLSDHHKDYQEAERWYIRAAADNSALNAMLAGKAIAQRGGYEEAEPYLRKAWEEGRDEAFGTETAGYYGLVLNRTGRHAEAVDLLRVAAEQWWEDVRSRYDSDDLDMLSRMLAPEEELEAAEQALAAPRADAGP